MANDKTGKFSSIVVDGIFSGSSHGFVVNHVAPEAAVGGPIVIIETGDS